MEPGKEQRLPERIQNGAAWLLAGDGLELQQGSVGLLLEGRIEGADGDDQSRRFLDMHTISI